MAIILNSTSGGSEKRPPKLPAARNRHEELLAPDELERYKNLYAFTQARVEGFLAGRHKSPFHGSSTEFADYHEYSAGHEISKIDWRVYGRTKELFIRRFEDETDMTVSVIVDVSRSMAYRGAGRFSKFTEAIRLAAAICYLATRQGDKAALGLVADRLIEHRKPGGSRLHLKNLVSLLEQARPHLQTSLAPALRQCAEVFRKKGRLVLISDFHDEIEDVLDALGSFVHRGFEVQLYQLLDPAERSLPAYNALEFVDLETGERVKADVADIVQIYKKRMNAIIRELETAAMGRQMRYHLLDQPNPLNTALEAYLLHGRKEGRQTLR